MNFSLSEVYLVLSFLIIFIVLFGSKLLGLKFMNFRSNFFRSVFCVYFWSKFYFLGFLFDLSLSITALRLERNLEKFQSLKDQFHICYSHCKNISLIKIKISMDSQKLTLFSSWVSSIK